MNCPFAAPGRQEACLSLQKQRTALMTREYDRNECYSCPMRRKRLEGAKEPERIAMPPTQFNNAEPFQSKKEDAVDQAKVKENVLRVLGRKGRMTISSLKLFAGAEESKENFHAAVDALAGEGKVEKKAGPRAGSFSVALPGTPEPTAQKTTPAVNRTSATPPIKTRAKSESPVPSPRKPAGNGVYAATIADLERRRTAALDTVERIGTAIETLRALA